MNEKKITIDVMNPDKLQEIRCYKIFVPQQIANFYTIMQQSLKLEFPDYAG